MRMRLYLDEDAMDDDLLAALRSQHIDVTTVNTEGRQGFSDEEQLLYATEQHRVIYSFNRKDFMVLHTQYVNQGRSHAGIILAPPRDRYSVGEQLRRLQIIIDTFTLEEIQNQALFLSNWG